MRKILFVTHTSFPYNSSGGGDAQMYMFIKFLNEEKIPAYAISSISKTSKKRKDFNLDFDCKLFELSVPNFLWSWPPFRIPLITMVYSKFILKKRNELALIHAFNYRLLSFVILFTRAFIKKPVVVHVIDPGSQLIKEAFLNAGSLLLRFARGVHYIIDKIEEYLALKLATVIVSDGVNVYTQLKEKFGDKVVFIPDIVNLPIDQNANNTRVFHKERDINNNDIIIAFIGRLVELKGIKLFVYAARLLSRKYNNLKFVVVGEGPESDFVNKHKDVISYFGFKSDVADIYKIVDIVIVPSQIEGGIPAVLLEAMSYGKIVIASDITNNCYVIRHGINGFLFKNGDLASLVRRILWVVDNWNSPNLDVVRLQAKKTAENFEPSQQVKKLINIYRLILGQELCKR